ncbi:MAG: hypothetical protein V1794_13405, partial [Candidatus Glassbacteria bacterium]
IIPFGLARAGWFSGLHERVPESMFNLLGSPLTSDYTPLYVLAIVLINLVGIVVQPHSMQTGGGAADSEMTARVGYCYGNYLKRFCTVGWAMVGVLGFALFAREVSDPDMIWGYATLRLLPVGLVGLMIAAMLAAIMSSADAFMVAGSALFTMNLYRPFRPLSSDSHLVRVGRLTTAFIITGGVLLSLLFHSVIELLKYIWTLPVIFGASFWLSFLWRRVTATAAWCAVVFSLFYSFVLPVALPGLDSVAGRPELLALTDRSYLEVRVGADSADVAAGRARTVGETIARRSEVPPSPIYFDRIVPGASGALHGAGKFRVGVWLVSQAGFDFHRFSSSSIEATVFLLDAVLPFIILIVVSLVSGPVDSQALDRFFARIHTPVQPDPEADRREVELSCRNPRRFDNRLWFPGSGWEMLRPDRTDIVGFVVAVVVAIAIVGLLFGMSAIRWP